MAGISGFPTTQKLVSSVSTSQKSLADFVTTQPSDAALRHNADVVARAAFRISTIRTAQANTGNPSDGGGTYVYDTATSARVGDFVRFVTGNAADLEIPIILVSTNYFILGAKLPTALVPAATDTFYIMRYSTPRVDSSGASLTSAATVDYSESVRLSYASTSVTSAAWVQLIASTAGDVTKITVFDSAGYAMELGIGAPASEVRKLLIPPGGLNGMIELTVPAGSRISVRAVGTATVSAGEICLNLFG